MRVLATALVAIVTFSVPQSGRAEPMTGAELKALLEGGREISLGGEGTGYSGKLQLNADGTGKGTAQTDDKKATFVMDGTWHIQGDQFCRTWKDLSEGKEVCETWDKVGDKINVMVDGKQIGTNRL